MPNEKKAPVVESVKMEDGRIVDFTGRQRLKKESYIAADGSISVRLDFKNGETRLWTLPPTMIAKFAAHGAEDKLGNETNGEDDIDDAVLVVDELIASLDKGQWSAKRAGDGMAGTSVLLRAIVKVTGKPVAAVKAYLAGKSQKVKMALRERPEFAPAVAEIEAKKKAKAPVDVGDAVGEIAAL